MTLSKKSASAPLPSPYTLRQLFVTFALSPTTVTFCHFFQNKIFPGNKKVNADNISKVLEQKKVNNDSFFNIS